MRATLIKRPLLAIAVLWLMVQFVFDVRAAQKQSESLWYKTVEISRVRKPNRALPRGFSKTQILPLLTLQWRLLKRLHGGATEEVDSKTVFKTGDQVQIGITPNQDGYLYFIFLTNRSGVLRNSQVFVRRNIENLAPSDCPPIAQKQILKSKRLRDDCFLEFSAPAPTSGVEEIVMIFSRNRITNLPRNSQEGDPLISAEAVEEIKSRSGQVVKEVPGKIERLLRGDPGRYALLVQNTNREDNEELVVALRLRHQQ